MIPTYIPNAASNNNIFSTIPYTTRVYILVVSGNLNILYTLYYKCPHASAVSKAVT